MLNFFSNSKSSQSKPLEVEFEEVSRKSFENLQTSDCVENPCLVKQGKNYYALCSRLQPSRENNINGLSLYPLNCGISPKLSTDFLPVQDNYTKIYLSRMSNGYFGCYQTKNQATYLTLFRVTGKGFKKMTTMKLYSSGIFTNNNALCFLESPYQCLFIPGDGTIKYIDLRRKVVLNETPAECFASLRYHSKLRIIAAKRKEELQILKLTADGKIVSLNLKITGYESFKGGLIRPDVNFLITQYADLKDYLFDDESNVLYVVFAWVSWTNRSVISSLPPTITHLRFQRWKIADDKLTLDDQNDVEWQHSRTQTFRFHLKHKQCIVNGLLGIYVICLETFKTVETIKGKELWAITNDDTLILKEASRLGL